MSKERAQQTCIYSALKLSVKSENLNSSKVSKKAQTNVFTLVVFFNVAK